MNNITFGAYYNSNSWLHRLDPRTKIISLILLMVGIFFIKNIYFLLGFLVFLLILIITSSVPIKQFFDNVKVLTTVLLFTFIFQILFNHTGNPVKGLEFSVSWLALGIDLGILIINTIITKLYPKLKFIRLVLVVFLILLTQNLIKENAFYTYAIYDGALHSTIKVLLRIICLVVLSSVLTFTTKPTDIAKALEKFGKPLKKIKIDSSIFAMLISISLRFVPTLINEAQKIMKSQASRGVDFKEGTFAQKIKQIVSLIIPMFIVSYKKADDLANAMEARGYVPGDERTSLYVMKYSSSDYITLVSSLLLTAGLIVAGVML